MIIFKPDGEPVSMQEAAWYKSDQVCIGNSGRGSMRVHLSPFCRAAFSLLWIFFILFASASAITKGWAWTLGSVVSAGKIVFFIIGESLHAQVCVA